MSFPCLGEGTTPEVISLNYTFIEFFYLLTKSEDGVDVDGPASAQQMQNAERLVAVLLGTGDIETEI